MQIPSVWFCPECGTVLYAGSVHGPRPCCPDHAQEFVTEETARLAQIGWRFEADKQTNNNGS